MENTGKNAGLVERWHASLEANAQVQGEATMESLRRFRGVAMFTAPLHAILAWLFTVYTPPASHPELSQWAGALVTAHWIACLTVVFAGWLTHTLLRRHERASPVAIVLQIVISGLYLYFGAHITLIDLVFNAGAGLASYLMICIMFGVLALMRPGIAVPVFGMTYMVFAYLLEHANVNPTQRTSLHVIAAVAPALALVTSWMNWAQYAKSVLLRRQLKRSNEALVAQQQELAFLADHDALTGLYNRREFIRLAQMELLRANRIPCDTAVIMVDLDFFKKVNDRYGHPGGDAVLKATAACLTRSLRATDTLARLGGEEFIVLLPATGREGALQAAAKMRDAVRNTSIELDDDAISVTASFGVSSLSAPHLGSVDALYAAADRALYVAKQLGRDRVEYAIPEGSELHSKADA